MVDRRRGRCRVAMTCYASFPELRVVTDVTRREFCPFEQQHFKAQKQNGYRHYGYAQKQQFHNLCHR